METKGQHVGDRRPIAARELTISKRLSRWIAARGMSANAISIVGMFVGLCGGVALALTAAWPELARLWWLLAAGCIQLRLLANMLDGMVAVETQTASPVGELYNEVPDRISDTATLVGLGYAAGSVPPLGYLAALAAIFTAYVRAVGRVAGAPQDYSGPMAKQQRMFTATLVALYGGLAPRAWQGAWPAGSDWGLPAWALVLIAVGSFYGGPPIAARGQDFETEPTMTGQARERLIGYQHAFDQPATWWIVVALVAALALAPILIFAFTTIRPSSDKLRDELWKRYLSWLVLVPLMVVPVLLGALWTILATALLSLLCYREFSHVTGLSRERTVNATAYVGILAVHFAVLDHWYGFFVALFPLTIGTIAAVAIFDDQPPGYIRRVALGSLGYALFGAGLAHLGYMANSADYRPLVLLLLLAVELNDVFAYLSGRTFGRRKLAPNTSPNKTVGGAVGALMLTTPLVAVIGHFVFEGTELDSPALLVALGIIVSSLGQLGDLMLSSVKRDLGIKDMGDAIPGHGGILDRFDSLILVAPAVFHYVQYFVGVGLDEPARIITLG